MHYGHPDMMNKELIIQQGGVSKATKTVNLSEDIFAGMDLTLRGEGRTIKHTEYMHLAKGRDLGFNTVLTFFAKLSSGTGEQVLTRQMLRLGHVMPLGEFLGFYYAHGGYYLTQHLLARSVPMLTFLWLLIVLDNPSSDPNPQRICDGCENLEGADIMAEMLAKSFSSLIGLFMMASTAPLVLEIWIEHGIIQAIGRLFLQMITGAPMHFIFQAKIIGIYVTSEIRYGGAAYLATGRGLPTDRRKVFNKSGGLYLDWAQHAFYDGFRLLLAFAMAVIFGAMGKKPETMAGLQWWCLSLLLTACSWLYAPFLFNPYQFAFPFLQNDWADWKEFFLAEQGKNWQDWHERSQLKPGSGLRSTVMDVIYWMMFCTAWYTSVNVKLSTVVHIANASRALTQVFVVAPPIFLSLAFCIVMGVVLREQCRLHLALAAVAVGLLDLAEAYLAVRKFIDYDMFLGIDWFKVFGAAVVLKYAILSLSLFCVECALRMKEDARMPPWWNMVKLPFKMWLLAHRMAFDLIVSMFIFVTLLPPVLFDRVRMACCAGCSIHQLLLFRDAGHSQREASSGAFDMYASAHMTTDPTEKSQEMTTGSFSRGARAPTQGRMS